MFAILRVMIMFVAGGILAGCQTTDPRVTAERQSAEHDTICQSWGQAKGTPGYANCRETLHMQEERRREQAIAYVERLQANRPPPMQIDQAPSRTSMQCSTTMSPGTAQTNCY